MKRERELSGESQVKIESARLPVSRREDLKVSEKKNSLGFKFFILFLDTVLGKFHIFLGKKFSNFILRVGN